MEKHSEIEQKLAKEEDDEIEKKVYSCPICDKKFIGGKSFGGHKRIHSLKKKEKIPLEVINMQFYDDKPSYYKCPLCPKTFRTTESLKEHEKLHSQREEIKGAQPSKTTTDSSAFSESSNALELIQDGQINLENAGKHKFSDISNNLAPTWLRTGRRSQNTRAHVCLSSSKEIKQAANNLIMLSRGELPEEQLRLKKRRRETTQLEKLPNQFNKGKGKSSKFTAKSATHIEQTSSTFVCSKCNKSFLSYHALGGHCSHHKKEIDREINEGLSGSGCSAGNNVVEDARD